MRYTKFIRLLLVLLLPYSYATGHEIREVHFAFVDEELAAILKALMDRELKTQQRTIVVIERGELSEGDLLFEQELRYYDPDCLTRLDTRTYHSGQQTDSSGDKRMQTLVNQLDAAIGGGANAPFLTIPFFPTNFAQRPAISTVTFTPKNPAAPTDEVICVVRSPEMGLQPLLTFAGLKIVLENLTRDCHNPVVSQLAAGNSFDLTVKPGPLADFKGAPTSLVSQLAAGGAIDVDVKPGELSQIGGSLYIGIELLMNERGEEYFQSKISLMSLISGIQKNYVTGPRYYLCLHKDQTPFEVYKRAMEDLDNTVMNLVRDDQLHEIRSDVHDIEAAGSGLAKVSLSTSFFTGDMYKDFGRAVGINCVSMEDYHLIRALWAVDRSGQLARRSIVVRQSEDPAVIPHEVEESFSQYLKGAKGTHPRRDYPQLSRASYKSVIEWGLVHGRDYGKLPAAAAWEWPEKIIAEDARYAELFFPLHTEDGRKVYINPFVEEIASDMLRMAAHGDFLREAMVDRSVVQEIRKKKLQAYLLKGQTELANQHIADLADQITALGSDIRKTMLESAEMAQPALCELDKLLQELTQRVDFVGGEKTPLRPQTLVPDYVRAVLWDPEFQEVFMPSKLGLADLQCRSPLLTWSPARREQFDRKMLIHFLDIQRGYLEADNPDDVNVLEHLGLQVYPGNLEQQVHADLLHGLDAQERAGFQSELQLVLRELKGDFIRILRNGISLRTTHTFAEIAESELLMENYYGILHFYTQLFEGHFPLPRVGYLAKKRSALDPDGPLSVWVRPYKWARNEAGLANHLPSDFILSDEALLEKLFSNYALQSSILDRCLYKATLGPAIKEAAARHVEETLPEFRSANE